MAKKAMPRAPRKTSFIVKFPIKILAELRRLAAFHCQAFVFLECEKNNRAGMSALMVEQFYGDPEKRIEGVCDQLINRDNVFVFLYNRDEGENGIKRTGNSTSTNYVAGVKKKKLVLNYNRLCELACCRHGRLSYPPK